MELMSERTGVQDGVQDAGREGEASGATKVLFEMAPGNDEEDLMFDNTPVFSTFFQDALDQAACTKGIAPKWRKGEDGILQLVLSPPPPPPPTSFEYAIYLLRKSQPFSVFAKTTTSMATGLLGKVLAMSRAGGGGDGSVHGSTSTVSEKRRQRPRRKDGGYYLKVAPGPRQRSSPRPQLQKPETASSTRIVSRTKTTDSASPRRPGPRDFLRRLTGDESIGRLYSDHTGQHLRLRSFHELSHERTERLSHELDAKTRGKQCNQPGAKFAARNSAKRQRERRQAEVDENKNDGGECHKVDTKIESSRKSPRPPSGGETRNVVRWRRGPLEDDSSLQHAYKSKSGKTSAAPPSAHSTGEAIFKMPAQSSDSKCKEWIFKNSKFFSS